MLFLLFDHFHVARVIVQAEQRHTLREELGGGRLAQNSAVHANARELDRESAGALDPLGLLFTKLLICCTPENQRAIERHLVGGLAAGDLLALLDWNPGKHTLQHVFALFGPNEVERCDEGRPFCLRHQMVAFSISAAGACVARARRSGLPEPRRGKSERNTTRRGTLYPDRKSVV